MTRKTEATGESTQETNSPASQESQAAADRRRRRRARISAQVLLRALTAPDPFEEICTTVDVSRDGLLIAANRPSYWTGQKLSVTFPYSSAVGARNLSQAGEVVRVTQKPGGEFRVAVQFFARHAAHPTAGRSARNDASASIGSGRIGSSPAPTSLGPVPAKAGHNLRTMNPRPPETSSHPAKGREQQKSIVLVIEPDTCAADSMRALLEQDGYTVMAVRTAKEAIEILQTTIPAVFIAEVEFEEMSGYDLCLIIKRSERLQHVPVVLLTRAAKPADFTESHKLGAVVCMAKPFRADRLQNVIRLVAPPPTAGSAYAMSHLAGDVERAL